MEVPSFKQIQEASDFDSAPPSPPAVALVSRIGVGRMVAVVRTVLITVVVVGLGQFFL
jgi:hypothetical protein